MKHRDDVEVINRSENTLRVRSSDYHKNFYCVETTVITVEGQAPRQLRITIENSHNKDGHGNRDTYMLAEDRNELRLIGQACLDLADKLDEYFVPGEAL